MPDTSTERHCHDCRASDETARLTLRDYCAACAQRIDEQHLYLRIPKPFTVEGLRTQARGLGCFLRAALVSAAGSTAHAREHGRLSSLKAVAAVWIDHWYVLRAAGWRR